MEIDSQGAPKMKLSMKQKRAAKDARRAEAKGAERAEKPASSHQSSHDSLFSGGGGAPPAKANPLSRTSNTTRAHLTGKAFAALPLSAPTQRAIKEVLGYETMTLVQEQTLPVALGGKDVIAKAKTGTGKTIGFLLPTIERLIKSGGIAGGTGAGNGNGRKGVRALAISPTRELAYQI
eukprot:930004-Prymnesium_polylepis.1